MFLLLQILIVWMDNSLAFQQASSFLFCGVSGTFLCPTFTAISYTPNSASVGAEIDDAPMNTSGENLSAGDALLPLTLPDACTPHALQALPRVAERKRTV